MEEFSLKQSRALMVASPGAASVLRLAAARALLIAVFIVQTNFGFAERVSLLLANGRFGTLLPYVAIWAISILAIYQIASTRPTALRWLMAGLVALSTAAAWGFHQASQSDLTVFDLVSLWSARHEGGRAAAFYAGPILLSFIVLATGLALLGAPPLTARSPIGRFFGRLVWLPVLPVATIAGVVFLHAGGGSQAMPAQFAPLALTSLVGAKLALQGSPVRQSVNWTPQKVGQVKSVVMLVDESIRADYLDLAPGNVHTPRLAALAEKFVNFGPAVSGGNCSNYSNAILRLGASRPDVAGSIGTRPTIWQYAKAAGYRTVFVDAQASINKNPGLMQNFMTAAEAAEIDAFYTIRDVGSDRADFRLIDIVREELGRDEPVFIYANKNGAHFPYDSSYPRSETIYRPAMHEAGAGDQAARIASYRNAISWSVDRFMERLFGTADLSGAVMVYTSDHGQNLKPGALSHCEVMNADPRTAHVPLLVYAADPAIRRDLAEGARRSAGRASHFQIVPSVLAWMGYSGRDIATVYGESLQTAPAAEPAFTTGDVFGMFSSDIMWTPTDPNGEYLEPEARTLLPVSATPDAGS